MIENMEKRLPSRQLATFKASMGEPFREQLKEWLKVFADPRKAIKEEIGSIRSLPYVPISVIFHGLLYELNTGNIEVVVNGYDQE